MYGKLYYAIYGYFKNKKNHDLLFNTSCLVFISQVIHFFILSLIVLKIFKMEFPKFSGDNSQNKLFFLPLAGIWIFILHKYFQNKLQILEKKYKNKVFLNNIYWIVILSIIIPLILLIKLSGGSIWK